MLLVEVSKIELKTTCMDCNMYRGCRFVKGKNGATIRILCAVKDEKNCSIRINRYDEKMKEYRNEVSC
ncbi:MAG: hypothetical protein WCR27_05430 [Eubacteriales bacterium]